MTNQEAVNHLKTLLKPGDKVYCILRHVSRSGMSRRIDFYVRSKRDKGMIRITRYVSQAVDYRTSKVDDALVVGGCGMDMGFSVVYNLGRKLWPKGGSLKHTNSTRAMQESRAGHKKERDGGYLLRHVWL